MMDTWSPALDQLLATFAIGPGGLAGGRLVIGGGETSVMQDAVNRWNAVSERFIVPSLESGFQPEELSDQRTIAVSVSFTPVSGWTADDYNEEASDLLYEQLMDLPVEDDTPTDRWFRSIYLLWWMPELDFDYQVAQAGGGMPDPDQLQRDIPYLPQRPEDQVIAYLVQLEGWTEDLVIDNDAGAGAGAGMGAVALVAALIALGS